MWYRYLHSHTWESPHFGNETFDTKKSNIRDPSIFMYHPKRPAKTNHLSFCSTSVSDLQVALMFLLIWIRSEVQKAGCRVWRWFLWHSSSNNLKSTGNAHGGSLARINGPKQNLVRCEEDLEKASLYVHILICIRCYGVVAIWKHKGMFSISFYKM